MILHETLLTVTVVSNNQFTVQHNNLVVLWGILTGDDSPGKKIFDSKCDSYTIRISDLLTNVTITGSNKSVNIFWNGNISYTILIPNPYQRKPPPIGDHPRVPQRNRN